MITEIIIIIIINVIIITSTLYTISILVQALIAFCIS